MQRCKHTQWLSLSTDGAESTLLESDKLQRLVKHIPDPDHQEPSLLVLIGNKSKAIALKESFGFKRYRGFRARRSAGEIHLHLDSRSAFGVRPLLVADSDLPDQNFQTKFAEQRCHNVKKRPLTGESALNVVAKDLFINLLYYFTDVFCFFSDDVGGLRVVAQEVAAWLERAHDSPIQIIRPSIAIIVNNVSTGSRSERETKRIFLQLLKAETLKDLSQRISDIHIISLFAEGTVSTDTRYRYLRERIVAYSDHVRKERRDNRSLFSSTHFVALFNYACATFRSSTKLNFIEASRQDNLVAVDLEEHLSSLLNQIHSSSVLMDFFIPTVASSFLLDSYPPDSHSKLKFH